MEKKEDENRSSRTKRLEAQTTWILPRHKARCAVFSTDAALSVSFSSTLDYLGWPRPGNLSFCLLDSFFLNTVQAPLNLGRGSGIGKFFERCAVLMHPCSWARVEMFGLYYVRL